MNTPKHISCLLCNNPVPLDTIVGIRLSYTCNPCQTTYHAWEPKDDKSFRITEFYMRIPYENYLILLEAFLSVKHPISIIIWSKPSHEIGLFSQYTRFFSMENDDALDFLAQGVNNIEKRLTKLINFI